MDNTIPTRGCTRRDSLCLSPKGPNGLFTKLNHQTSLYTTDSVLDMASPTQSISSTIFTTTNLLSRTPSPLTTTVTTPSVSPVGGHASNLLLPEPSPEAYSPLFTTITVSKAQKINMHLLRSCALLTCNQPVRALQAADIALKHAQDYGIGCMIAKSHVHRGLALASLNRLSEAENEFAKGGEVRRRALSVRTLKEGSTVKESVIGKQVEEERQTEKMEGHVQGSKGAFAEHMVNQGKKGNKINAKKDKKGFRERDVLWGVWGLDEK